MTRAVEIRAPAEQTEGTRSQILRWLKAVGESVTENEPLIELETDKVTVEVAAPGSGVLSEILKQEQEEIGPGELLGRIESAAALESAVAVPLTAAQSVVAVTEKSTSTVNPAAAPGSGAAKQSSAAHAPAQVSSSAQASASTQGFASSQQPASASADRNNANALSPAVRRLLAEHGLDAASIAGTGVGGRITVEDVLQRAGQSTGDAASKSAQRSAGNSATAAAATARPAVSASGVSTGAAAATATDVTGPSRRVPHSAVRKRIAEHMVQSLLHTAPHVTTVFEINLSAVLEHRQRHREDFARRGAQLTLTAYFLQATVDAIRAVPEANSRWRDSELEIFESIHIGVGTALESGLVVPVLHDVQALDLFGIARGLDDLVSRAREGRLTPADMRGGTFTISNHGVSGSLIATPIIINQPQAAILGVGKMEKRAVVVTENGADRVVIQPRCYVTLTIDHRVMDGHQANRFLQTFVQRLETSLP